MTLSKLSEHYRSRFSDERTYQSHSRLLQESLEHLYWRIAASLTQAEAARLLEVERWVIHRAIKRRELRTNGRDGRDCLIDPCDFKSFALAWRARERRRN